MTATEVCGERLTAPGVDKANAVVVAYADDRSGMAALRYAAAEARLRDAQLQVVHQLVGSEVPDRLSTVREYLHKRDRVAAHIRSAVEAAAPDLSDVYVLVTTDRVADEIVVASRRAALVVMGLTATHAATSAFLDGNAREVSRDAHCPVVLVPDGYRETDPRLLVCGVDRSPESLADLHWAAADAGLRGVNVLAVEVGPHGSMTTANLNQLPLSRWVNEHAPAAPTTIICRAERGSPASLLLNEASVRTGMLIIGRHDDRRSWFTRSVFSATTAQTRVPVVIVPLSNQSP